MFTTIKNIQLARKKTTRFLPTSAVLNTDFEYVPPPVNNPPVANDDFAACLNNTTTSGNVLANDVDSDDDLLVVSRVNGIVGNMGSVVPGSNGGLFTIGSDGSWTFNPAGDFAMLEGSETADTSVSYHASDGTAESMATLTVTVSGVSHANAAPVAMDDTGTTDAVTTISGNVLTNDTDADLDSLTVTQVAGSAANVGVVVIGSGGGLFTIASDGAWTFDPSGDFAGLTGSDTATTSVTYHASDGVGEAMATLTVTVSATAVETDPYWANVSVCINADDGIVDAKGHTLNLGGNVAVSNILGYQTIYFDGSGDHISIPNFVGVELGAGDFCIDFMVRFSNLRAQQVVYSKGGNWGSAGGIIAFIYGDSVITHAFGSTTWLFQQGSNAPTLSTSNLYHIAFSRHGNILRVFVDGSLRREATITGNGTSATTFPFVIGNDRDFNAPQSPMHITAFRVTKGVPRYTAAFSPLPDKYFPTA